MDFKQLMLDAKKPVYIQISDFVKRMIFLGYTQHGEALPSRRELAVVLEINPNTAQKAFKLMEEQGFVVTEPASGSHIFLNDGLRAAIENEMKAQLVDDFIYKARENHLSYKQVIELISQRWTEDSDIQP